MPTQVWPIIAVIFLYFSAFFWRLSNSPIRMFHFRQGGETTELKPDETDTDKFTADFLLEFDGYLASVNRLNKTRYRLSSAGFFVSGLTAVVAFALDTWLT